MVVLMCFTSMSFAQEFTLGLVKKNTEKALIEQAIHSQHKEDEIDINQLIKVRSGQNVFYIAPIISVEKKAAGCYLQTLNSDYKVVGRFMVEKSEGVQSCDSIIAVYGCKLTPNNGIGVIAGMRLGANNYFTEGVVFHLLEDGMLMENSNLSKLISDVDTVRKAKKKLACLR